METNLTYDMYAPTRIMFGTEMLDKLGERPISGHYTRIIISNG